MGIFIEVTNVNGDLSGSDWSLYIVDTLLKTASETGSELTVIGKEYFRDTSLFNRYTLLLNTGSEKMIRVLKQSEGIWVRTVSCGDAKPNNTYSVLDVFNEETSIPIDGLPLRFGIAHSESAAVSLDVESLLLSSVCTENSSSIENYKLAKRVLEAKYGAGKKSSRIIRLYVGCSSIIVMCNGKEKTTYQNVSDHEFPWYN